MKLISIIVIVILVVLGLLMFNHKSASQETAVVIPPQTNTVIEEPKVETKVEVVAEKPKPIVAKLVVKNPVQRYSKDEVIQLIIKYSAEYGISDKRPLCIAKGESGYQDTVISPSGKYYGVFQYDLTTWAGTDEGKAGRSVLDADANVKAAIKYMASRGHSNPWKRQTSLCPYPLHN